MADVIIVGAGLAGLSCACHLSAKGVSCQLLEGSDDAGGRARTDALDGFLLDRGFQVFLTAYPEGRQLLHYDTLDLKPFVPGALVRFEGKFHRIADPWRRPSAVVSTLLSPIGNIKDKLKLAELRNDLTKGKSKRSDETSTIQFLRDYGFSPSLIERFFRPFLGGVFLDRELQTSSAMFAFVFRMFSLGEAVLPAPGMGALAQQLAGRLPTGCLRLQQQVVAIEPGVVKLRSGEELRARHVVVATDQANAAKLLPEISAGSFRATTCFYFAADKPPIAEPVLVLNGDGRGPINNLCVPSAVAPSYAPSGAHLISASVVGENTLSPDELLAQVRGPLEEWFGEEVRGWRHLRTYRIPHALPQIAPREISAAKNEVRLGIYTCGDYRETASINGALASGRKIAEEILSKA